MDKDPVLKELHEAKDKLAAKYGFSVERLGRALMRRQKVHRRRATAASAAARASNDRAER